MKKGSLFTAFLVILIATLLFPKTSPLQENPLVWEVYFSPRGGATDAIIGTLTAAQKTILIQAYEFTSSPIGDALLVAHKRGVKIELIIDNKRKATQGSRIPFLFENGITIKTDSAHNAAHNKLIIIDGTTVITGSFNFTRAAEKSNAENLLIIRDRNLAEIYLKNFEDHKKHSRSYGGKGK